MFLFLVKIFALLRASSLVAQILLKFVIGLLESLNQELIVIISP